MLLLMLISLLIDIDITRLRLTSVVIMPYDVRRLLMLSKVVCATVFLTNVVLWMLLLLLMRMLRLLRMLLRMRTRRTSGATRRTWHLHRRRLRLQHTSIHR